MQPRKRTQFVRVQYLTEFSSFKRSELCQVISKVPYTSVTVPSYVKYFSTSYVKYLVPSYVKYLQKYAHGSEGTVTCMHMLCYARMYTCMLRIHKKPSTQPVAYVGNRGSFSLYCWSGHLVNSLATSSVSKGFASFGLIWLYFMRVAMENSASSIT